MSTKTPATEGQAKIRQLLTDLRYGHFDSDAIGEINSMLDQALAILDASPPIVGEPVAWRNPANDVALCLSEIERRGGDKGACSEPLYSHPPVRSKALTDEEIDRITDDLGLGSRGRCSFRAGLRYARDNGYLAQAPQSSPTPGVKPDGIMNEGYIEATRAHGSPAPSVIEAGDAMENMMRRLRTQRDDEGILPTGNDFNGMDGLCAAWVAAKASRPSVTAPQGVTVDQDKCVHCGRLRSTPDEPNR